MLTLLCDIEIGNEGVRCIDHAERPRRRTLDRRRRNEITTQMPNAVDRSSPRATSSGSSNKKMQAAGGRAPASKAKVSNQHAGLYYKSSDSSAKSIEILKSSSWDVDYRQPNWWRTCLESTKKKLTVLYNALKIIKFSCPSCAWAHSHTHIRIQIHPNKRKDIHTYIHTYIYIYIYIYTYTYT